LSLSVTDRFRFWLLGGSELVGWIGAKDGVGARDRLISVKIEDRVDAGDAEV